MRIVIAGGSGLLGRALVQRLRGAHEVSVLTRRPRAAGDVMWTPGSTAGPWTGAVQAADAVVNLAGESIAGRRWTPARKQAIRDSRVLSTRSLVAALRTAPRPPLLINASAIGIYGPHGDEPLTEDSPPGSDFLASVCTDWETEALKAADVTRVVLLRTGLVLARDGGALPQLALPFRFFVGGPLGSGRQYSSWIHRDDWVEMVVWSLITDAVRGPLNLTAPEPVTNAELARALGRVMRRPAIVPAPALAIRLALGEMADMILTGQRVLPAKAQSLGFSFRYPTLGSALESFYGRV